MNAKSLKLIATISLALATISISFADTNKNKPLHIAVASNFTNTLQTIGDAFQQETGHSIIFSSASSGQLYAQIIQGAPFDLFLSADSERPLKLEQDKMAIANTRFTYAIGRLALYTPNSKEELNEKWLQQNIGTINFKISIANPKVAPYGVAAMQYLQSQTLWHSYQEHLILGQSISQTYHYAKSENVAAGLVALSTLIQENTRPQHYYLIPAIHHKPIRQQAILLRESTGARLFIQFLKSNASQTIIKNAGYDLQENL